MKKFLAISLLPLCFLATACGSDSSEESTADSPERSSQQWPALERLAGGGRDRLIVPSGPPPKRVVVRDLENGRGRQIKQGDWFTTSYVSFDYETRQVTEDKRGTNKWYWVWGSDRLTQGWEIGLRGLRVGDLRELIVPSGLAYGDGARVYVIRLLALNDPLRR
jgi:peptidylprolyl isomerase